MDNKSINEKLSVLPESIRRVYFQIYTSSLLRDVAKKHKLMIDQVGALVEETGLVVLGVKSVKNFVENIAKKLAIDPSAAEQIAAEINTQIFSKIREELQKLDNVPARAPLPPEPKPYTPPAATPRPTTNNLQPTTTAPTHPTDLGLPKGRSGEVQPAPVISPKIETTPFEQKLKEDEIFRAPAVVSEHEAPPAIQQTTDNKQLSTEQKTILPPLPTKTEIKYGGKDPYKEPIE